MNTKKAGWLFFIVIAVHIILVSILAQIPGMKEDMSIGWSLMLGESIIGIPALVFLVSACIREHVSPVEVLGLHRIRIGTVFLMILYTLLLLPMTTCVNLISMLFATEMVTSTAESVLEYPPMLILLFSGLIGPAIEEIGCRGLIFGGMRREMSALAAGMLSALAFGFIHMNFNQCMYAFFLGFFMAMAVEATGSLWGSLILHITVNSEQTIKMLLVDRFAPGIYSDPAVTSLTRDQLYLPIAVYFFVGCVCMTLAVGVLIGAAHHEGRLDVLGRLTKPSHPFKKLITIPYILAAFIAVAFMIYFELRA